MLRQGILAYSSNGLLDDVRKTGAQLFIARLESLDEDIKEMFDWLCVPPNPTYIEDHNMNDDPRKNDTYVSPLGFELVMAELKEEYDAWRELEKLAINGNEKLVDQILDENARAYGGSHARRKGMRRARRHGSDALIAGDVARGR